MPREVKESKGRHSPRVQRNSTLRLSIITTICSLLLYLAFSGTAMVRIVEGYALDLRFRLRGVQPPGDEVVLVLADDRSIESIGRWTWSRSVFASALHKLQTAGARVIAFDLLFTEPTATVSLDVAREVAESVVIPEGQTAQPGSSTIAGLAALREELAVDEDFGRAISAAGNVVVPFTFLQRLPGYLGPPVRSATSTLRASSYRSFRQTPAEELPFRPADLLEPVPPIAKSASSLGHVNVALDADGTARYEYPVVHYQGKYYPSLAIQTARLYLGRRIEEMRVEFGDGIRVGKTLVPTDESMRMVVNFYGPNQTFPSYSFADVLEGRISDSVFKNKAVLIGAAATGVADRFLSPFSGVLGGTERIATIISNILHDDFVVRRGAYLLIDLTIAFITGIALGFLGIQTSAYFLSFVTLLIGAALMIANYWVFLYAQIWLNVTLPLYTLLVSYAAISLFSYIYHEREEARISQALGRYLHPQVVEMMKAEGYQDPRPEARYATVLFTDIEGFTPLAERTTPQRLVDVLREYFDAISEPINRHGGMVTQFQGDALVAIFNVHTDLEDHAAEALKAALEITAICAKRDFAEQKLHTRIGINTGDVTAGSVGSRDHMTYTVHGDAVNLAARLQSLAKDFGVSVLLSDSTYNQLRGCHECRNLGDVEIRGKRSRVTIYTTA